MQHDVFLVGTYHKTGTVWMERVFTEVAGKLGLSFTGTHLGMGQRAPEPGIYQDEHCHFPESLLSADCVGFRMIRDPRDVAISGAHYHMKTHETWLHQPLDAFGGKTYQEAILAEPDMAARYVFEAQQVANATTLSMVQDYERLSEFITVRYEEWVTDETMSCFGATMAQMGLSADECALARQAFFDWSLFGRGGNMDDHARSGKVAQWRTVFSRRLGESFLEMHGDALVTLGYEKNHDWVLSLPVA